MQLGLGLGKSSGGLDYEEKSKQLMILLFGAPTACPVTKGPFEVITFSPGHKTKEVEDFSNAEVLMGSKMGLHKKSRSKGLL